MKQVQFFHEIVNSTYNADSLSKTINEWIKVHGEDKLYFQVLNITQQVAMGSSLPHVVVMVEYDE